MQRGRVMILGVAVVAGAAIWNGVERTGPVRANNSLFHGNGNSYLRHAGEYRGAARLDDKWNVGILVQSDYRTPGRGTVQINWASHERIYATPMPPELIPTATPGPTPTGPTPTGGFETLPSAPRYQEQLGPIPIALDARTGVFRVKSKHTRFGKITLNGEMPASWRAGQFTLSVGARSARGALKDEWYSLEMDATPTPFGMSPVRETRTPDWNATATPTPNPNATATVTPIPPSPLQ